MACRIYIFRYLIRIVSISVDRCGQKFNRIILFQIRRTIGNDRITGGMCFVEGV